MSRKQIIQRIMQNTVLKLKVFIKMLRVFIKTSYLNSPPPKKNKQVSNVLPMLAHNANATLLTPGRVTSRRR